MTVKTQLSILWIVMLFFAFYSICLEHRITALQDNINLLMDDDNLDQARIYRIENDLYALTLED